MDFGFNHLKAALPLTESEDAGVAIASNLWYSDSDSHELYLVGRLLSHKPFHADALKSTLPLAFNPVRGMNFKLLEDHRFLLKFNHIVDRNRVLNGCPWSFERNLLILSAITMNENPQEVNLDWAAFHIHVHGLPLSKMSKEMSHFIGDHLGRFIDVDADSTGQVWGSSMRLRISLDVTKPLRRVLKIRTSLGDEQLLSFTYEKLPNFCYLCGCLGYLSKFCELRFAEKFTDPGDATPFDPWMRATNLPTGRNRYLAGATHQSTPHFSSPAHKFSSRSSSQTPPHNPPRGASIFGSFSPIASPTTPTNTHLIPLSPTSAAMHASHSDTLTHKMDLLHIQTFFPHSPSTPYCRHTPTSLPNLCPSHSPIPRASIVPPIPLHSHNHSDHNPHLLWPDSQT
ncbi:UNVERIFIED_CONTAM: hypothetical protein Slati_2341300 [Sesamum latifolium]|uniref:DUF4283 domain-containing protein n=1 Tax=Sesamum latifolium TaxID=2727402 RepID=A0AAW2WAB4_9LAMI